MGVALAGFMICVGVIVFYFNSLQSSANKYEELAQMKQESVEQTEAEAAQDLEETDLPQEAVQEEIVEEYVSPIDFNKLQTEENSDIYAWIQVDGTTVDYPVLQHPTDDSYYLMHNIDGS